MGTLSAISWAVVDIERAIIHSGKEGVFGISEESED